jgi:hypothetical protein
MVHSICLSTRDPSLIPKCLFSSSLLIHYHGRQILSVCHGPRSRSQPGALLDVKGGHGFLVLGRRVTSTEPATQASFRSRDLSSFALLLIVSTGQHGI